MNRDLQEAGLPGIRFAIEDNLINGIGFEDPDTMLTWGARFGYALGSGWGALHRNGVDYTARTFYTQYSLAATLSAFRGEEHLFSIYPRASLGVDIINLELRRDNTATGSDTGNEALMEKSWWQSVTLTKIAPSLDVGVIGAINIPFLGDEERGFSSTLPVEVGGGYHFVPVSSAWSSGGSISGLGDPELSHFYLHLTFGFDIKGRVCPRPNAVKED